MPQNMKYTNDSVMGVREGILSFSLRINFTNQLLRTEHFSNRAKCMRRHKLPVMVVISGL